MSWSRSTDFLDSDHSFVNEKEGGIHIYSKHHGVTLKICMFIDDSSTEGKEEHLVHLALRVPHFKVVQINLAFAGEDIGAQARGQLVENLAGFLSCSWGVAAVVLSRHCKTVLTHASGRMLGPSHLRCKKSKSTCVAKNSFQGANLYEGRDH